MSYTGNDHVYASLHESGANDFLKAIYYQRPSYFRRGTPYYAPFPPGTTTLDPPLFNVIEYLVAFGLPRVDFYGFPSLLSPHPPAAANQFLLTVNADITTVLFGQTSMLIKAVGVAVPDAVNKTMFFNFIDVDLTPATFPANVVMAVLNAAIKGFSIPYPSFPLGAFTPVLSGPPYIHTNKFMLRGNL
jgi:hypothetical protein